MGFRGRVSEFRTNAGNASCIVSRLNPSLTVMSRAPQKFPPRARKKDKDKAETQRPAETAFTLRSVKASDVRGDNGARDCGRASRGFQPRRTARVRNAGESQEPR